MKVGSIVICIDDSNWSKDVHELFNILPIKGNIYRVSQIHPNYSSKNGPPGVSVEGIVGKVEEMKTYWDQILPIEWHFKIKRFKEISMLENNIEISNEIENVGAPILVSV